MLKKRPTKYECIDAERNPFIRLGFCSLILSFFLLNYACEPALPENLPITPIPADTLVYLLDPGDTCSIDTVYFEQEILPILISNCAITGCHDTQSANKGIITESYESIMRNENLIQRDRPPNLTKFYAVISSTDIEKIMPPLPNNPLPQNQIRLIEKWLDQGFRNNRCVRVCDTSQITFSKTIAPIVETFCKGCHRGPNPAGEIDFNSFEAIQKSGLNGSLYGAITHNGSYSAMPPNQKLSDCKAEIIRIWVEAGAPNN